LRNSGQSKLCACIGGLGYITMYLLGFMAFAVALAATQRLGCYPAPTGSSSGSDDDQAAAECGMWFLEWFTLLKLALFAAFGVVCGWLGRERVGRFLGASESSRLGSFWLHCCPCTHPLALCQEARALKVAGASTYGGAV
jgi:hypothetical protein